MLAGKVKRIFTSGPGGPAGATLAAALQDVVASVKTVLTAPDLASARAAFGLGNVANLAPADLPVSTAAAQALAAEATRAQTAEQANATAIGNNATAISAEVARATTAEGLLAPKARQIATGAAGGLTGGGDLSADRALAIATNGVTNAMLAQAPTLTLKANLLGSTANVTDVSFSALLDAVLGNTRGAVLYRGSGAWAALAPGAVGQYLGSGGAGADPSWGTPAGAGNVSTSGSPSAGQFALFASGTSIKGIAAPSFRNRLINGNFAINQRGAASASTAYSAGAYVMDRWKAGASGATLSFATAANGVDVVVTITAGSLVQVIEGGMYLPEGGAYLLSWSGTATARVYQGTATGAYAASPVAVTGLTAGTNASVEISTGTISLAQFEPGTTATAFERRDDEVRRARRYYEVGIGYIYGNAYAAGANLGIMVRMVEKRAVPNYSVSGINASNMNPPTAQAIDVQYVLFYATATTGTGQCYYQFYWYASAEL